MIPGITDTDENLEAVMEFIKPLKNINRLSLLPYNMLGEDKRDKFQIKQTLSSMKTQSMEFLDNKSLRFRDNGYEVKIGG